ncbi:MAG: Hsp20/alpha crystallin family protein [Clostridia bacterium]|nr:Hsp20/alpha crystallin family protein [Clostridia bacterium]
MFEMIPFERRGSRRLAAYDPFRELNDLSRAFFGGDSLSVFKTDIREEGDHYLLETDLPGFKKEDIKVDVEGDVLTVSAERNAEKEEKDEKGNYLRRERSYGSYSRSFDISNVNSEEIKVAYKDGVLALTLPKKTAEVPASRRLEIE